MKVLFANIGNRNISIDWEFDFIDEKWFIKKEFFKEKTKEILANFDEWKNRLKLNILDIVPLNKFNKIYLVGTNQSWENDKQDTFYAAEIVKKLIGDDNIEVLKYETNPTDRKAVLYYYKKIFSERLNKDNKLYLFVSGGVPAMKEAMVWAGLSTDLDISILEAVNGKLVESKIEQLYLKEIYKKSLKLFLENYDWFGAIKLIEENKKIFWNAVDYLNKLKYLNARFNFDFDLANKILDEVSLTLTEEDLFEKIQIGSHLDGIKELLDNIEITYKKWEYTMLLGKVFRLQEAIYRYVFETLTNISTEKDENNGFIEFINYVENNQKLKDYLVSNNINYSQPNTLVLAKILSYFKDNGKLWKYQAIFSIASSIDGLKNDRNLSIMAHWWGGLGKSDIDDYKLIKKISSIKQFLWINENKLDMIKSHMLNDLSIL